jgi:hypothetical protein
MEPNEKVSFLITKAGVIAGSEYKLAKEMGIPQTILTDWKAGRRTCTPSDRARLAGFAREDAVQELVRATIEAAKGTKREQLQRVLGKLSRQTGAAAHTVVLTVASLTFGIAMIDVPRCIKSN